MPRSTTHDVEAEGKRKGQDEAEDNAAAKHSPSGGGLRAHNGCRARDSLSVQLLRSTTLQLFPQQRKYTS